MGSAARAPHSSRLAQSLPSVQPVSHRDKCCAPDGAPSLKETKQPLNGSLVTWYFFHPEGEVIYLH